MIRFLLIVLCVGLLVPAGVRAQGIESLCYTTFDCPTDRGFECRDLGTREAGMGVCRTPSDVGVFDNPLKATSITELLMSVLRAVVRIVGVLLVLAFVFIGFQFVAAQGNTEALSKARQNLMWTAIGAAILLGAEGIALVIEATARSLAL